MKISNKLIDINLKHILECTERMSYVTDGDFLNESGEEEFTYEPIRDHLLNYQLVFKSGNVYYLTDLAQKVLRLGGWAEYQEILINEDQRAKQQLNHERLISKYRAKLTAIQYWTFWPIFLIAIFSSTFSFFQSSVFEFEHQPRFKIYEGWTNLDSLDNCITETIQINNAGYLINSKEIEIYSFFEISDSSGQRTVFPVEFYYSIGRISKNETGELETYTHSGNCKKYFELQNHLNSTNESYFWRLKRFHVVSIEWSNFKDERQTIYLKSDIHQPNQEISPSYAKELIALHKEDFILNIQETFDFEKIRSLVKDKDYNKQD